MKLKETRLYKLITGASARMHEEHIDLYSAHAAFFLFISLIPLLMLLLSLFRVLFPHAEETLTVEVLSVLPEGFRSFFEVILNELFTKQTIPIVSISALLMLWSASRGVLSVMRGLRDVYRGAKLPLYRERLLALLYTVALIITLLFILVVLVFGDAVFTLIFSALPGLNDSSTIIIVSKFLLSAVLITLFSLLLYTAMAPKPYNTLKVQFPGALFTAAGCGCAIKIEAK